MCIKNSTDSWDLVMQNGQIQNYENAIYDIHSNFILFEGYLKTLFFIVWVDVLCLSS